MLDLRRMRLLRELAYRGTIAAVAQAMAYTPSAVSQQLATLEREAGVPLLRRTGRTVALTPAGQTLVRHTEVMLEQLEQAAAELATGTITGPLRIGAFPTATRRLLPLALTRLAQEHPRLEPMVDELDPAGVAEAIRSRRLDLALVHEYDLAPTEPDPTIHTEHLLAEPMYLATRTATGSDPLRDMATAPWIVGSPGTLCHAMTVQACHHAGFAPQLRHRVDDFDAVLALVAADQGVALVPQLAIAGAPAGVVLTELAMRRHTHLAYRRGAGGGPAVTAFATALRIAASEVSFSQKVTSGGAGQPAQRAG